MRYSSIAAIIIGLAVAGTSFSAQAEPTVAGHHFGILKGQTTEPWLAPKYHSPRGTRQHVVTPRPVPTPSLRVETPSSIVVPQTGIALPNTRTLSPSGPNGTETFQDRSIRCTQQAGAYGSLTGNRTMYMGSCLSR
jgi:hypothetical protein